MALELLSQLYTFENSTKCSKVCLFHVRINLTCFMVVYAPIFPRIKVCVPRHLEMRVCKGKND